MRLAMRVFRAFATALSFLTRIPVSVRAVTPDDLGRSLACFPLVGALLGLLAVGCATLARHTVSYLLGSLAVVALSALVTGGLHLDGVADLFDGLGGARGDRTRALAIMRDSRIGAHGATALTLTLLGKTFAGAELLQSNSLAVFFAAPVIARFSAVLLIVWFPYARSAGLGFAMHQRARVLHLLLAGVLMAACLAPLGAIPSFQLTAAGIVVLLLAAAVSRTLGGLTGDVYGAAIELCELTVLVIGTIVRVKIVR